MGGQSEPMSNLAVEPMEAVRQPVRVRLTAGQLAELRRMPEAVMTGLRVLRDGAVPSVADTAAWHGIVLDAIHLAADGWAGRALRLGWSMHDLWGVSPDWEGLAVWLAGHRLLLLDDRSAVADAGDGRRVQFTRCRHGMPGARLLWELG